MLGENTNTVECLKTGDGIFGGVPMPQQSDRPREKAAGFDFDGRPDAYRRYLLIHKRIVGPKTVPRLLDIHEELSGIDSAFYQYIAGSAAVEAGLAAEDDSEIARLALIAMGNDNIERAIDLQHQADLAGGIATTASPVVYKMLLSRAFIPVYEGIVTQSVDESLLRDAYLSILKISAENALDYHTVKSTKQGTWGGHVGLEFELKTIQFINRKMRRLQIAAPSLARADIGVVYPSQTHDTQVIHHQYGRILNYGTMEVKAGGDQQLPYEAAIVNGRKHLGFRNLQFPFDTQYLLMKEAEGTASEQEIEQLDLISDMVLHLLRHQQTRDPGVPKHCARVDLCTAFEGDDNYLERSKPFRKAPISSRRSRQLQLYGRVLRKAS